MAEYAQDFLNAYLNGGAAHAQASPWELKRYRFTNLTLLLLSAVAPPFILVYRLIGLPHAPVAIGVCFLIVVSAMVAIRWTGQAEVAGHLATFGAYIAITVSLFDLGGMYTSAYCWFLLPPMMSGLLVGLRACLMWSTVMVLTMGTFWVGHLVGDVIPPPLPEPLVFYQSFFTAVGAQLTVVILCLGFLQQTRQAQQRAEVTIAALDAEVATRTQAETDAKEALAARSRFIAMMSHEIRTPLNGMLGMGRLLSETELDPEQQDLLQTSLGSGETLLTVLNDVLDFSKLDAGKMSVESIAVPIRRLTRELVALYRPTAEAKGLFLRLDEEPDVPEWTLSDPTRLRQVLGNLLSNAVKFTSTGGIVVRMGTEHGKLMITVADTGIGIESSALNTLFDAFTQAETSTTRRYGGTGLGLTIGGQLMRLMDGAISRHQCCQQRLDVYDRVSEPTVCAAGGSDDFRSRRRPAEPACVGGGG